MSVVTSTVHVMSEYVVTRIRRGMKDSEDCNPVPLKEDGSNWLWCCQFAGHTKTVWADDVVSIVAALTGEDGYAKMSARDAAVARIRFAVRTQVAVQSNLLAAAHMNGDWDRCTESEKEVILAPRYEQPSPEMDGFSRHLFGSAMWSAPLPLILVTTGYLNREMPRGPEATLWLIDPTDEEALLESLDGIGVITVAFASDME